MIIYEIDPLTPAWRRMFVASPSCRLPSVYSRFSSRHLFVFIFLQEICFRFYGSYFSHHMFGACIFYRTWPLRMRSCPQSKARIAGIGWFVVSETAVRAIQKAVSAYFTSKQILPFGFALQKSRLRCCAKAKNSNCSYCLYVGNKLSGLCSMENLHRQNNSHW